jgi:hypothetical protein
MRSCRYTVGGSCCFCMKLRKTPTFPKKKPLHHPSPTSVSFAEISYLDLLPFGNFYPSHSAPLVAYINILHSPQKNIRFLDVEQEKPNVYSKRSLRKDIDTAVTERQFCWCYISE